MLYRLWFRDGVGHPLTLTGFKLVRDDAGFDVWKDTTTLFTHVLRGHVEVGGDADAELVASGVLRIRVRDFAKQLTTFRAGGPSVGAQLGALVKFGWIFIGPARPGLPAQAPLTMSKRKEKRLKAAQQAGRAPSGRTRVLGVLAGGAVVAVFSAEAARDLAAGDAAR